MYIEKLPNAAAGKISVTSTATRLYALIDTAAGESAGLESKNLNAVDIMVEDGDVRVAWQNTTPTATNGFLLSQGVRYYFPGVPLTTMQLIRVGGSDVACSVSVGKSKPGENFSAVATSVTLEAESVEIGSIDGTGTQGSAVDDKGLQAMAEAKNFDGSALPNTVDEGDAVRIAGSLSGVQYSMPVNEDGSKTPLVTDDSAQVATPEFLNVGGEYRSGAPTVYTDGDATILQTSLNGYLKIDGVGSQNQTVGASSILQGAEGKDFDGSALPNTVTEGNTARVAATLSGVQYVMVVNEDGSEQPAYDSGTDSFKSFEVSPLSSHHVEETLADVTNETNATTNRFIDMDGFRNLGIQFEKTGGADTVTLTLEATIQDDGTAAASITDFIDVTTDLTGSASFTTDQMILIDTPLPIKYLKVKTVSTGGGNDADYAIYIKKLY